jgi:hypothetical protein
MIHSSLYQFLWGNYLPTSPNNKRSSFSLLWLWILHDSLTMKSKFKHDIMLKNILLNKYVILIKMIQLRVFFQKMRQLSLDYWVERLVVHCVNGWWLLTSSFKSDIHDIFISQCNFNYRLRQLSRGWLRWPLGWTLGEWSHIICFHTFWLIVRDTLVEVSEVVTWTCNPFFHFQNSNTCFRIQVI